MAQGVQFYSNSSSLALSNLRPFSSSSSNAVVLLQLHSHRRFRRCSQLHIGPRSRNLSSPAKFAAVKCSERPIGETLRTCRICKTQFDPSLNHPRACRFHTAHFGGETKRKFESVYTGGTMNTPNSGEVLEYWHCCGSEDPFDPGCTASPHSSYDD